MCLNYARIGKSIKYTTQHPPKIATRIESCDRKDICKIFLFHFLLNRIKPENESFPVLSLLFSVLVWCRCTISWDHLCRSKCIRCLCLSQFAIHTDSQ